MAYVSLATAHWAYRAAEDAGLIENGVPDFVHLVMVPVRTHDITSFDDVADLAETEPLACEFLTAGLADLKEFARSRSSGWMLQ